MAPVAGMPPNSGDTRLAMPCATSSTLELWRVPAMPSATTAESRLSTAASKATVSAEGMSGMMCSDLKSGITNRGKPLGMPPNLLPMVATGSPVATTKIVQTASATIEPGTRRVSRGNNRMMASVAMASAAASQ
jgi:hypothetical protein